MNDGRNAQGRGYWERAWGTVQGVQEFPLHSDVIDSFKWEYLREDLPVHRGRAAELGCGSGHLGSLLAQDGFDVAMVDYSPAAISCARRSFSGLSGRERKSYLMGDLMALPLADASLDVVISCGVLEHFESPQRALNEMVRVLRPGGVLYADIWPDRFSLLRIVERLHRPDRQWFEARMSRQDIAAMVDACGLEIIRLFTAGVLPPRSFPGTGRIPLLGRMEKAFIRGLAGFWRSLDGTPVADLLGSYHYMTARKPTARTAP